MLDQKAIKEIFRRIQETKLEPSFAQKTATRDDWDRAVRYAREKQGININTIVGD